MDDAFRVGEIDGGGGLAQEGEEKILVGRGFVEEEFFEGGAVDVLHKDVDDVVDFLNVVDGDDVGMGEDAGALGFAEDAVLNCAAVRGGRRFLRDAGMDSAADGAADGGVLGFVDEHPWLLVPVPAG
jgi:hypothetical protein